MSKNEDRRENSQDQIVENKSILHFILQKQTDSILNPVIPPSFSLSCPCGNKKKLREKKDALMRRKKNAWRLFPAFSFLSSPRGDETKSSPKRAPTLALILLTDD